MRVPGVSPLSILLYCAVSFFSLSFSNFHLMYFFQSARVFCSALPLILHAISPECLCCVWVTSWKIYYSFLFICSFYLCPSLPPSICPSLSLTGLYNDLTSSILSSSSLWLYVSLLLCYFSPPRAARQSSHSFLSFEPFHLSTAICLGTKV